MVQVRAGRKAAANFDWIPGFFDGPVYLVASGQSVAKLFPAKRNPAIEKGDIDFSSLNGKNVVAISHCIRFIDAQVCVFLDGSVLQNMKQDFYAEPYRTVIGPSVPMEAQGNVAKVATASTPGKHPRDGFFGSFSSGYFALNFCLAAGASKVYLIGLDCGDVDGKTHFYATNHVKGYNRGGGPRYEKMIRGFEKFKGYPVYTVGGYSKIPYFPTVTLEEALC